MDFKRNRVTPAAFLILKRKNEVLLQRRFNTGFQDGKYSFISGHVDTNESPVAAICREANEEAGITVKPKDIQFEQVMYRRSFNPVGIGFQKTDAPERVDFFFSTEKWEGEPHITEPDKCDDLRWFPIDDLPINMFPIAKDFIMEYAKHSPYKEAGYEI